MTWTGDCSFPLKALATTATGIIIVWCNLISISLLGRREAKCGDFCTLNAFTRWNTDLPRCPSLYGCQLLNTCSRYNSATAQGWIREKGPFAVRSHAVETSHPRIQRTHHQNLCQRCLSEKPTPSEVRTSQLSSPRSEAPRTPQPLQLRHDLRKST